MHAKTGIKEVFMKALKISENVYWVGAIDWNVRNFHGYETEKGTTYNAYLILDEKITLVDTVKDCLQEEMLERIRSVIEPDKIDVIISNHAEPDHSGALPFILRHAPRAKVYAVSPAGEKDLGGYYGDLPVVGVKTGTNCPSANTNSPSFPRPWCTGLTTWSAI